MVSIILCTYNRSSLLLRAVQSVLAQTMQEWELIVIDDGSTDTTGAIMERMAGSEKRIRYFRQRNMGLAKARNAGLRRARGSYICFVDSDDELTPSHIALRVKYLKSHPEVDFLHGGMRLLGPKKKHYVVDMTDNSKKIHLNNCTVGGTFFFRKKILRVVRGFNAIPFGEDFDFFRRVQKKFVIHKVRFPTYRYHLEADNRLCDVFTEKLLN